MIEWRNERGSEWVIEWRNERKRVTCDVVGEGGREVGREEKGWVSE